MRSCPPKPHTRPLSPTRRGGGLACALLGAVALFSVLAGGCSSPRPAKALIIGIDGADWSILNRLIAEGALPNLARLKAEGTWAELISQEPILSPIIWTTIATGKTPEKHGITWFMVDNPKTGGRMPVTSNVRKVKAFWNMLTASDVSVGVLGWWATWPAETVNGFIISDFLEFHGFGVTGRSVKTEIGKTYPAELLQEIQPQMRNPKDIGYETVSRFMNLSREEFEQNASQAFDFKVPFHHFRNILSTAESYQGIALKLIAEKKPRVMAVYFEGIDSTSHLFMQHAPPALPWIPDPDYQRYHRVVDEYYKFQDQLIGDLLKTADADTTVFVLSDHGFKTGEARPRQEDQIDVANAHKWHHLKGVLIARGPSVQRGAQLKKASITDITPTLLHLLGLPKGEDMDGVVLTDLFTPEWLKTHPVKTVPTWDTTPKKEVEVSAAGDTDTVAPEISAEAEEKLRALGYIGDSDDSSSEVHDNMGNIELRKGNVEDAIASFQKAIKMEPLNPGPHVTLGALYKEQGRYLDAVRELEFALTLKPDNQNIRVQLGDVYFAQGKYDEALKIYDEARAKEPGNIPAHIGVGNVWRMKNDSAKARVEFEKARELAPKNFVPVYNLGVLAQAEGRNDEARKLYQEATRLAPRVAVVHNNYGNLLEHEGDIDGAIVEYRAAAEADPKHFESRYNLGTMLLRKGEFRDAEKALKEALSLKPDAPFAHNNLAQVYMRLGWHQKALEEFKLLTRLAPKNANAWYQAGRLLAAGGQKDEAVKMIKSAFAIGGAEMRKAASADPVFQKAGIDPKSI